MFDFIKKIGNVLILITSCFIYNTSSKIICKVKILLNKHENCTCENGLGKNFIKYIINNSDITVKKFIQWISMRPDLINNRLYNIFNTFKNNCKTHDFKYSYFILNKYFENIEDFFTDLQEIPVASGSIAQVHVAKLNGNKVAIKIKHPDIDNSIKNYNVFIKIILSITKHVFQLNINVDIIEFYKKIIEQTNFILEAENARIMEKCYHNTTIIIPKVLYAFNDVIIYEYIDSCDFDVYSCDNNIDKQKDIALKFLSSMYIPIFIDNIFHADIHDKNWGISNNNNIVIYDFGFMRTIDFNLMINVLKVTSIYDPFSILFTLLKAEEEFFELNLIKIQKYKMSNVKLSTYCSENYKMINTFINLFYDLNIKVCPALLNFIMNALVIEKYVIKYNLEQDFEENTQDMTRINLINNLIDGTNKLYTTDNENKQKILNVYYNILSFIRNHLYIKKKITAIKNTLLTFNVDISNLMIDVIISLINTVLIHSDIFPTDIIDIMNYVEKKISCPKLHQRINKVSDLFKKYDKSIYLLLKLQKNILIKAKKYELNETVMSENELYDNFLNSIDVFLDEI